MASVRQQAELVFDSNNYSYLAPTSVCADTTIVRQLTAAYAAAGVTYTLTCGASASAWAAAAPLKGGGAFCVDSTGAAKTTQGVGSTAYTAVSGAATAALTTATTDYDCN
ncbi:MAG: hypothetical protein AB199_01175 [Parcubacteria bacterium C7867-004]|nr:MAG: hypothetical protein AB199_01175 [Parcubacteria bacterium C7867-004]